MSTKPADATEAPTFEAPVPSWRRELDAMRAVCEILDPLDPATRRRAFAAVLCTMSDEAAAAAIGAWQAANGRG